MIYFITAIALLFGGVEATATGEANVVDAPKYHGYQESINANYFPNSSWIPFPVIGIVAQEIDSILQDQGDVTLSYIAASYVKYVESAGGVALPIRLNQTEEYYKKVFNSINGLLIPGGEADIADSEYSRVSRRFYDMALVENSKGQYFPIFGICLGFEQLLYMTAEENPLVECKGRNQNSKIELTEDFQHSKILKNMSKELLDDMVHNEHTFNSHSYCITTEKTRAMKKLKEFYWMPATSKDKEGVDYIAFIEAREHPFFGTQWHPEKPQFEWNNAVILHDEMSVAEGQFFANYLMKIARRNKHRITSSDTDLLIFKDKPTYTAQYSPFIQVYTFSDFAQSRRKEPKSLGAKRYLDL